MRNALTAMFLVAAVAPALAQQGAATVNGYSAAQRAKAETAARAAGYAPTRVADAQAGNIFLWAMKDGREHFLTVTPDGTVHVSGTGAPSAAASGPAAGR